MADALRVKLLALAALAAAIVIAAPASSGAVGSACPTETPGEWNPNDALPVWLATGKVAFTRRLMGRYGFSQYICSVDPAMHDENVVTGAYNYGVDVPAFSPDESHVALAEVSVVVAVDLVSGARHDIASIGSCCVGGVRWSPDGSWIAFAGGGVHLVRPDGTDRVDLGPGGNPEWSPRGVSLAYSTGGTVVVRDENGTHQVAPGTRGVWSPDGTSLAIENGGTISVVRADGSDARVVATGKDPAWSRDGSWIALSSDAALRLVALGGDTVTVAEKGAAPAWSRDGRLLAFVAPDACGRAAIFVRDVLAATTKIVTNDCRINGTAGPDDIVATNNDDLVHAGAGADIVLGRDGSDVLYGGSGADAISGGLGYDRVYGGRGDDHLRGDYVVGGPGHDVIVGQSGYRTKLYARDGERDVVICGSVPTVVFADRIDQVSKTCKHVIRG